MIEIILNGERTLIPETSTVAQLLDDHNIERRGIAVAKNRCVIVRSAWDHETFVAGDRLEIVTAAAGG